MTFPRIPFIYYCNDHWMTHLSQMQVGQWGAWNQSQVAFRNPWHQRFTAAWIAFTGRGDVIVNPYAGSDPTWKGSIMPLWARPYMCILRVGAILTRRK